MADIFRSKEVYKHAPKEEGGQERIIPVKGVYVTGEYRPPYYAENGIQITMFDSGRATVVDYTSTYLDTTTSEGMYVYDLKATRGVYYFTRYTRDSDETSPSDGMYVYDLGATVGDYSMLRYTRAYYETTPSDGMYVYDLGAETGTISRVVAYTIDTAQFSPDAAVTLEGLTSTVATIENVI